MTVAKESAYAKINLYLDVLSKREDGFHDIKTVMHSVSLFDKVTVAVVPSKKLKISLSIEGAPELHNDGRNLACRAAALFYEKMGCNAEVKIKLVKNIPISAGLAGGSSDAAAVLRALNRIYRKPFTLKALAKIGAELGSDVPYCVIGKTALCEGRGELIKPLKNKNEINAVIVSTDENISTPEAYGTLDALYSDFDGSVPTGGGAYYSRIIGELENGIISSDGMFNVFENVILQKCRKASAVKEMLESLGAEKAMMSGSGPSIFGVFKNAEMAEKARQIVEKSGFRAWRVKSV